MTKEEATQKFLKLYCKNRAFCELYPEYCKEDKCEIYHALKALEAEPKRGKWVFTEYESGEAEYCCSECREGVYNRPNYCPNCGARMDEVKND